MKPIQGKYQMSDLSVGDYILVGHGHLGVGWNSACDDDWNRRIDFRVHRVKSLRKSVVLESGNTWSIDRVEVDQVIARFTSREIAAKAAEAARTLWESRKARIQEMEAELRAEKEKRLWDTIWEAQRWTNN